MIAVVASPPETLERWRASARRCLAGSLNPGQLVWNADGSVTGLLGARIGEGFGRALPGLEAHGPHPVQPRVPRRFMALAASVACHRDDSRWSLLYDLLWRLTHGEPHLLQVVSDPLVFRLVRMHRSVRRASHKMKAFVRFRRLPDAAGGEQFVAWFEPAQRVVERTAPFFVERFPSMRWSILTPDGCARWDGKQLHLTGGIERHQAPADGDALEELWKTYYAGTFNPARLNRSAMLAEMPVRYWRNLPEAAVIATLAREAPARVTTMIAQTLAAPTPLPTDLDGIESPPTFVPVEPEASWDPVHDPGWRAARSRADRVRPGAHDPVRLGDATLSIGVAGWTDPTLLADGVFYPPDATFPEARLRFYASRLSMVEVDATYYALPSEDTARRWAERTPEGFVFDVKAHSLMTGHPTNPARLPAWLTDDLPVRLRAARNVYAHHFSREAIDMVWTRYLSALEPLRAAGKLGAIMLQFPRWFTPTREAAAFLRRARERLGDCPASVELRHRDWLSDRMAARTFALLRSLGLSYVAVDAPPGMESSMPPTMEITNTDLAIVRLHGRRVSTWEARNDIVTERYRYLYSRSQLAAWLPSIRRASLEARQVHLIFNNNHANYATTNALEMHEQVVAELPAA